MTDPIKEQCTESHSREHLANERTFLAWIRTSIGIMAFGFVIERFAFFIEKLSYFIAAYALPEPKNISLSMKISSVFGISLVAFGGILCLFAFIQYKKTERQIESNTYQPTLFLDLMLTLAVLFMGIFITIYLTTSA